MHRLNEIISDNAIALFVSMSLLGGLISHQRYVEGRDGMTLRQNLCSLVVRTLGAGFGGVMVMFVWSATEWPIQYGYVASGIMGMYSVQFFDWVFCLFKVIAEMKLAGRKL